MNTHKICFDTHLGRLTYNVSADEVMTKVEQIMACPGPWNLSVEMLDNDDSN